MQYEEIIIEYGSIIVELAYNNPEIVSAIIAAVVTLLYRKFNGQWPLLSSARRVFLPIAEILFQERFPVEFTREMRLNELAGTYEISPKKLNKEFRDADLIYPDNIAKLKYRMVDGERNYEYSSWAYRPDGILGKFQVHLMVFANDDGTTDLYAHYELNYFALPVRHYFGGGHFEPKRGVRKAREIMADILGESVVNPLSNYISDQE